MTQAAQTTFCGSKNVVARRNQDGTVILMRLDETSFFYKLDGLAAQVWTELGSPRTLQGLTAHFASNYPASAGQLEADVAAIVGRLKELQLLADSAVAADSRYTVTALPQYRAGAIKEFNLEQIESEVLNESIYLDVFAGSDLRLKTDITPITGALDKVRGLEGVNYRWNPETTPSSVNARTLQAGLIAQDVAQQMPELVRRDPESGTLAVEYRKLTAYLVEAIKDLHRTTAEQDRRIRELESALNASINH